MQTRACGRSNEAAQQDHKVAVFLGAEDPMTGPALLVSRAPMWGVIIDWSTPEGLALLHAYVEWEKASPRDYVSDGTHVDNERKRTTLIYHNKEAATEARAWVLERLQAIGA